MKKVFLTVQRDLVMMLNVIVDTLMMRAVDCLVFFFYCTFQQCSTLKQRENELCCSLYLGVGRGAFYSCLLKIIFT